MKVRGNTAVKAVAFILAVVLLLGTVFFGACAIFAGVLGAYTGNFTRNKDEFMASVLGNYAYEVACSYADGEDIEYLYGDNNFYYKIESSDDSVTVSEAFGPSLQEVTVSYVAVVHRNVYYDVYGNIATDVWHDNVFFDDAVYETTVIEDFDGMEYSVDGEDEPTEVTYVIDDNYFFEAEALPSDETKDVRYSVYGQTEVEEITYAICDSLFAGAGLLPREDTNAASYSAEVPLQEVEETVTVTLYEKAQKQSSDLLSIARFWVDAVYNMRTLSIILAASCFILLIATWIFLFCSAGYRQKSTEPTLGFVDRIPFDIFTAICAALFVLVGGVCIWLIELPMYNHYSAFSTQFTFVFTVGICIAICAVVLYLIVLGYLLSFATRVKVGGLIRSTVIYRGIAFVCSAVHRFVRALPLVWKTSLILLGVSVFEFMLLLINAHEPDNLINLWILEKLIVVPLIVWAALMLRKLKKGGEAIAEGRLTEKLDTKHMPLDFGDFGETLNNIGGGLERAVDEKLRSERLKTELITNVSHDIKTPLTSIVNYVDLIKKEDIENEKVREYVDVLDRHSARLKKLIEDLVEASKASTGNISVEPTRCDACVLLEQSLGEYSERLADSGLTPVTTQPSEPVYIMADGRRLWRVFDNLLCNICKYAMPNTRVYITLERVDDSAVITFRNISREPLNINGDELMERFVRGDASRNTEGSGLGLSIARSLAELQGGTLDLTVDGDLFKAVVKFNVVE